MYRFIFLDLDNTLLDFDAAEHAALSRAYREAGVEPTAQLLARYREINNDAWERYERGEVSQQRLLVERHALLFRELGLDRDAEAVELQYRRYLGVGHWFIDGAEDALRYLKARGYRLYLASNGVIETQASRLQSAGILPFFDGVFISEATGYHKPEPEYFAYCFARIPGFDAAAALLIGDSLSSDVRGGKLAGIATCWFNRRGQTAPPDCMPDYEIRALSELRQIL